jgi:chitin deacetylase
MWSADSGDWHKPSATRIATRILRQAQPGGIGLLHDGGGNRDQTVAALSTIIRVLKERGYRFVTVPELLEMRYVAPKKVAPAKRVPASHKKATQQASHKLAHPLRVPSHKATPPATSH